MFTAHVFLLALVVLCALVVGIPYVLALVNDHREDVAVEESTRG